MLDFLHCRFDENEVSRHLPDLTAEERERIRESLLDSTSGIWKCMAPVWPDGRALILGAGWHNTFLFFAECYRETVVWDPDPRRISVLRHLAGLFGLNPNFESGPLEPLLNRLPQQDLIFFEKSLSWVPNHLTNGSSGSLEKMLQKSAERLTDRGVCLISIDNRMSLDRLLGRKSAPTITELPGVEGSETDGDNGSQVPRKISLLQLLRSSRRAHFSSHRIYAAYPSLESPREILGWQKDEPLKTNSRILQAFHRVGLSKYFSESPVVAVSRKVAPTNFIEDLLGDLHGRMNLLCVPQILECAISNGNTAQLLLEMDGAERAVLHVPLCKVGLERVENSRTMLEWVHQRSSPWLRPLLPKVLHYHTFRGQPYLLRSYVSGADARTLLRSSPDSFPVIDHIADILLQWPHETTTLTPEICEQHFFSYFRDARPFLPKATDVLDTLEDFLRNNLDGHVLPLTVAHGDFHTGNLLLDPATNRLSGIVDWDLAESSGLPMLDLFHLLVSKERDANKCCIGEAFIHGLLNGNLGEREEQLIERHRRLLGVDRQLVPCLAIAYWSRHCLGNLIRSGGIKPESWMQDNIYNVLDAAREALLSPAWEANEYSMAHYARALHPRFGIS